jgi:hypothetical protein
MADGIMNGFLGDAKQVRRHKIILEQNGTRSIKTAVNLVQA